MFDYAIIRLEAPRMLNSNHLTNTLQIGDLGQKTIDALNKFLPPTYQFRPQGDEYVRLQRTTIGPCEEIFRREPAGRGDLSLESRVAKAGALSDLT